MRKQVLRGRTICRDDILNRERALQENLRLDLVWLTILFLKKSGKSWKNYIPYLHQTKLIRRFSRGYLLLLLKNAKSVKNHLVRSVLPQLDRKGRSKPCEGADRLCEAFESVKDTTEVKEAESDETFNNLKGPLDCNSNNVIYLSNAKNISLNSPM